MMLATKMSYVSNETTLTAYKTAIGADAVERITFDDLTSPYGLKISYPDVVVWAVQGTTTFAQYNSILALNGVCFDAVVHPNADRLPVYKAMGKFHRAMNTLSAGWFTKMEEWLATTDSRKRWFVTGHSLGAATWQCVLPKLEAYSSARSVHGTYTGDVQRYPNWNFQGGYVFGCPLVRQFQADLDPYEIEFVNGLPAVSTNRSILCSAFARKVTHYVHPFDPIPLIPQYASVLEYPLWWNAVATAAQLLGQLSNYTFNDFAIGHVMAGQEDQRFYDRNKELTSFPRSTDAFFERFQNYHYINVYIDRMRERLQRDHGAEPADWTSLISLVRDAPQDDALPI